MTDQPTAPPMSYQPNGPEAPVRLRTKVLALVLCAAFVVFGAVLIVWALNQARPAPDPARTPEIEARD